MGRRGKTKNRARSHSPTPEGQKRGVRPEPRMGDVPDLWQMAMHKAVDGRFFARGGSTHTVEYDAVITEEMLDDARVCSHMDPDMPRDLVVAMAMRGMPRRIAKPVSSKMK